MKTGLFFKPRNKVKVCHDLKPEHPVGTGLWSHSHRSHAASSSSRREQQQDRCLPSVQPASLPLCSWSCCCLCARESPGTCQAARARLWAQLGPAGGGRGCQALASACAASVPQITSQPARPCCLPQSSPAAPQQQTFPLPPTLRGSSWGSAGRNRTAANRRCSVVSPEESSPCEGTRRQG